MWLAIAAAGAAAAAVPLWRSAQPDALRRAAARLEYRVDGFGLYVDERVCAECHAAAAASHPQTGHAKTFVPSTQSRIAATLNGKTFKDPERGYTYHYRFDPQEGLSVTVPEQLGEASFPLAYTVGSGTHAATFVTLIPSRLGGTAGVEHRVSVRLDGAGVDMEVTRGHQGQGPQQDVEHFGRVIDAPAIIRCLDCHATRGEILDHALHGLEPNVGCQKCHWPGREHVMAMRKAKAEGRVFPNAKEPAALEQIRACSRCHLQPGAGDELEAMPNHIRSVRVQAPELLQSRCFSQSKNRLSCSTCHDPHAPISRDPAHYVQRCLTCHGVPNSVACPVSPRKDCVRCHTPVVPAENGSPWHDHRIRKPAGGRSEVAPKERTLNPEP